MRLNLLFALTKDKDILNELFKVYPDQKHNKRGYENALKEIRHLKPNTKTDQYVIHCVQKTDDDEAYYDVYGTNGTMSEWNPEKEETWALEYSPWDEWLSWEVDIVDMTKERFLACCLFEMTFVGYSYEEQKKEAEEVMGRCDEVEEMNETDKFSENKWEDMVKLANEINEANGVNY